jgi:hypothetical protein
VFGSLSYLHKEGFIDLYHGDASHFGLTPDVFYTWRQKNAQILLLWRKSSGLTVFALLTIDSKKGHYPLQDNLKFSELTGYPDAFCKTINKRTVIVLDNAPIQRSSLFKSKIEQWQKKDLYIFFSAPYSLELNKIEILRRFIKYKRLSFDAFLNFQNLKECLNDILANNGTEYGINF